MDPVERHDPMLYFPPLPDAEAHEELARQLAMQDRENARKFLKFVGPVAAVTAAAAIVLVRAETPQTKPAEPNDASNCVDFSKDVLKSPAGDRFGIGGTGVELNPAQVSIIGMTPIADQVNVDGRPVLARNGGKIINRGGKLHATGIDMPADYRKSLNGILASKALRWGICQLDGGMEVTFTDSAGYENGEYAPEAQTIESRLIAGKPTPGLYPNQRAWTYMVTHEEGHELRQRVLSSNAQPEITSLYKELGTTYRTHLEKVLEDYRKDHGKDVGATLDAVGKQLNTLDDKLMDSSGKAQYAAAVKYLKQQLDTPGGLKDLAITEIAPDPTVKGSGNISLTRLNGLIAKASTKVDPENPLYGIDEIVQDSGGKVDRKLITDSDKALSKYIDQRFPSEKVFADDNGGHPDNDDELGASLYVLTGYSDASKDSRITANLPDSYKADAQHELSIARQIREKINPGLFAKPVVKNSTSTPPSTPSR